MFDTYILCTSPRSGSTMLCDLLRQTGIAGWPESFFRVPSLPDFTAAWGLPTPDGPNWDQTYFDTAMARARGSNPIAGLRTMWSGMAPLQTRLAQFHPNAPTDTARLTAAFGRTAYLFLERTDKLAQAISRTRAEQSGLWHRNADGSVREQTGPAHTPQFDAAMIQSYLDEQTRDIAAWTAWFSTHKIKPHRITYEALCDDPTTTTHAILSHLHLDPNTAAPLAPGTAKLADDLNRDWATRFRATR